ncbi:hypothetical protein SDC9_188671 [bioreactor metagenome]|uniref:Uncharacterized protein n=1 Tax=bioreactor metagenome TaxID=1076179 RepID=A0A645HSD4_9ZZZZ
MDFPDELSLLSLFECEPELLDNVVPFYYNTATYKFGNMCNEKFIINISPSYSDIKIQVYTFDNILISSLDFERVSSVIILSDKRNESYILIKTECASIEIHFKQRFTIILKYFGSH